MTTKAFCLGLSFVASGVLSQAQTAPSGPPPNYPPQDPYYYNPNAQQQPASQGPYYRYNDPNNAPIIQGTITVPYAFDWHAVGVSGELGTLFQNQHFVGAEVSYYGSDSRRYDVYNFNSYVSSFRSEQNVTTIDAAYRYYVPLGYGMNSPVSLYVGGSAGVGFVDYTNSGSAFGFRKHNDANFTGEFLIGLQLNPYGRGFGARVGYRYIFVDHVWRYDRRIDLDSSALEASVSFRF